MDIITVTVGRNVRPSHPTLANKPLSDNDWRAYVSEVSHLLRRYAANRTSWIEVHYGIGTWDGVAEESAKITIHDARTGGSAVPTLTRALRYLAGCHDQDALAVSVGRSELITVRG